MSYGTTLRLALEALLAGESGSTRTMSSARFHRCPADTDAPPAHSAERAVRVYIRPGTYVHPHNTRDPHCLKRHRVTVRVWYALTHAGGDLAEGLTEQHGPGTLDAVSDRATTDEHDIATVLTWGENTAGLSPHISSLVPNGEPSDPAQEGNTAHVDFPYEMLVWANNTTVGEYAP